MEGFADAYYTRDAVSYTQINYQQGGGTSVVQFYSSQEWAKTIVDSATKVGGWVGAGSAFHCMCLCVVIIFLNFCVYNIPSLDRAYSIWESGGLASKNSTRRQGGITACSS